MYWHQKFEQQCMVKEHNSFFYYISIHHKTTQAGFDVFLIVTYVTSNSNLQIFVNQMVLFQIKWENN